MCDIPIYSIIFMCCVACYFATHDIPYDIASLETQAAGKSAITWRFRGRSIGDHIAAMEPQLIGSMWHDAIRGNCTYIITHTHIYIYTSIYIYIYIV